MARSKLPPLKLDICKVDTARLRALPLSDLHNVSRCVGMLYDFPKRDEVVYVFTRDQTPQMIARNPRKFRNVLAKFVSALRHSRAPLSPYELKPSKGETEEGNRAHHMRMREQYAKDADRIERVIWQAQVHAGCKVRGAEIVARDLEHENKRDEANKVRAAERVRTPYKGRRKPIIR